MGGYLMEAQLHQAKEHGLQLILMRRPGEESLRKIKEHPNFLGIVWQDEPLINFKFSDQNKQLDEFRKYKAMVHRVAPNLIVFVNTSSWITGHGRPWWVKWNEAGDISCHDNYMIWPVTRSINLGSFGTAQNGVADTVSLAVKINNESKPVWLIVPAFESVEGPSARFPFRYPTPMQLRAIVYAGIIHGATGITYYAWDSNITRFGISPEPVPQIPGKPAAKPMQCIMAKALWQTAAQINSELHQLTPAILSPTVGPEIPYKVLVEGDAITTAPIRTLLKPHPEGGFVLLTVNLDNAPLKATLCFEKPLSRLHVLFENQNPEEKLDRPKSIVREYEPFDVHIFQLNFAE
jgi:hypothetical protein